MEPSTDSARLEAARGLLAATGLREALSGIEVFLVGGVVRDALLGRDVGDIDLAIDGEVGLVLERLGIAGRAHERFGTARVELDGVVVDLARTRTETYARPGALPDVRPAPIRVDLARRDFTINAIAVALEGELELLDPYEGVADLAAGLLRVIHPRSFSDDPTRALRAARYAARFGFELEAETADLLGRVDLGTLSEDRVQAELARICAEEAAVDAIRLLERWGLLQLAPERAALIEPLAELALLEPWAHTVTRQELLFELLSGGPERLDLARRIATADPATAAAGYELAQPNDDLVLALARTLGATWLDDYMAEWRRVVLAIDGADLLAAGIPEGPAVGRGLRAARHARIEGSIAGDREQELEIALAAARGAPEVGA